MRWKEIVSLNENFIPVCDIKGKESNYWKRFIPHRDFYTLLNKTILMYQDAQKAVWLQGTYGSGKTHATMVVKEIFSQDLDGVKNYIEGSIKDSKIKSTLLNLKKDFKTFPIVLKGSYFIVDSRSFNYAIQKESMAALERAGIKSDIKTSFETIVTHIEKQPTFWKEIVESSELQFEIDGDIEILKERLRQYDSHMLMLCEDELRKRGLHIGVDDIVKFLEEVAGIVKKEGFSNITLFWDEFTSVLETPNYNDVFMSLQNIAENIKNKNVFLFIVSHRTINADRVKDKDAKHISDRFNIIHYQMEDVTTYHLLAHSIKKSEYYEDIAKAIYDKESFKEIIIHITSNISDDDYNITPNNIRNMLPIHPYSGLILSMIARQLKSSNRSIFDFLYSEDGFIKFLENESPMLMDIGYLWDYFLDSFDEDEKLHIYTSKYSYFKEQFKEKGISEDYLHILKTILLLNVINKVIGGNELDFTKTLIPNRENLEYIFRFTNYLNLLDEALEYIDKNCIKKDVDGVFLVSTAILPEYEISQEIEKLKLGGFRTILKVLEPKRNDIVSLVKNGVLRYSEIDLREANLKDYDIKRYADKFKKDYSLKIMLFFAIELREILNLKDTLLSISKEFKNVAFIIVENSFSSKSYNDFISYKARSAVAKRHNHEGESERNQKQALKIVENYVNSLKNSSLSIFFRGEVKNSVSIKIISDELKIISKRIFYASADLSNINGYKLWQLQNPTKTLPQNVLKSKIRDELSTYLNGQYKPLINLIKEKSDYVLDENFNVKPQYSEHFVAKIFNKIDEIIKKKERGGDINLSRSLKILTKEPYGFYSNPIFLTLLSLGLKRYDGKFYEIGTGRKIEGMLLADKIVDIFKYFEGNSKNDVRVRFGTEIDEKFFNILKELFGLEDGIGIKQGLFEIKDWIQARKYPLWVTKYSTNNEYVKKAIDKLNFFVNAHDEDISMEDKKEFVDLVEKSFLIMDLELLLDKDRFEEYFEKFLDSLDSLDSLDLVGKKDEIYDYVKHNIRANQDSDIAGWDEDNVQKLIYKWSVEAVKDRENQEKLSKNKNQEDSKEFKGSVKIEEPKPTFDEMESFKNKIKYMNLTMIVLENVEKDIELYRVLKKYVED